MNRIYVFVSFFLPRISSAFCPIVDGCGLSGTWFGSSPSKRGFFFVLKVHFYYYVHYHWDSLRVLVVVDLQELDFVHRNLLMMVDHQELDWTSSEHLFVGALLLFLIAAPHDLQIRIISSSWWSYSIEWILFDNWWW